MNVTVPDSYAVYSLQAMVKQVDRHRSLTTSSRPLMASARSHESCYHPYVETTLLTMHARLRQPVQFRCRVTDDFGQLQAVKGVRRDFRYYFQTALDVHPCLWPFTPSCPCQVVTLLDRLVIL